MIHNKLIFLDIDGVLNHTAALSDGVELVADKIALLRRLVGNTDANIVLSSSWRVLYNMEQLTAMFAVLGFIKIPIVAATPSLDNKPRGYEIRQWLADKAPFADYLILDDDLDMLDSQLPYLVHTNMHCGLLSCQVDEAIVTLSAGIPFNNDSTISRLKQQRKEDVGEVYPEFA